MSQAVDHRTPDRPTSTCADAPRRGRATSSTADGTVAAVRMALHGLLAAALCVVAALTLTPEGTGWSWGSPVTELLWYSSGLDSAATMRQLVGNLVLLVVPAALAVLLWPSVGNPSRLVGAALGTGAAVEVLQWVLPLGRVVSPVDALLNAAGAVVAGLLTSAVARLPRSVPRW
jgi:hypothetical protein